jgi:hypothetical protein
MSNTTSPATYLSGADASKADASKADASKADAPKVDAPKVDNLSTFVADAIEVYKSKFASFRSISTGKVENENKLHQASMHITDIAISIAGEFQRLHNEVKDPNLSFTIVSQLIADSRVCKSMNLDTKLWEDITGLAQFENLEDYNKFVNIIQNRDQLSKEMKKCCC